jgi:hypothetical protein
MLFAKRRCASGMRRREISLLAVKRWVGGGDGGTALRAGGSGVVSHGMIGSGLLWDFCGRKVRLSGADCWDDAMVVFVAASIIALVV